MNDLRWADLPAPRAGRFELTGRTRSMLENWSMVTLPFVPVRHDDGAGRRGRMDSFEAEGVRFDIETSRADPRGFWVVAWDGTLPDCLSIEACVRAITAAQDVARQRFPGRGGVVRFALASCD